MLWCPALRTFYEEWWRQVTLTIRCLTYSTMIIADSTWTPLYNGNRDRLWLWGWNILLCPALWEEIGCFSNECLTTSSETLHRETAWARCFIVFHRKQWCTDHAEVGEIGTSEPFLGFSMRGSREQWAQLNCKCLCSARLSRHLLGLVLTVPFFSQLVWLTNDRFPPAVRITKGFASVADESGDRHLCRLFELPTLSILFNTLCEVTPDNCVPFLIRRRV